MVTNVQLPPGGLATEPPRRIAPPVDAPSLRGSSAAESHRAIEFLAQQEAGASVAGQERSMRIATEMLQRHLAHRGEGTLGAATVRVRGEAGVSILEGVGLLARGPGGRQNVGAALLADPLVLLAVAGPESAVHWTLLPGGESVTARADALRLLRMLSAPGALTFAFRDHEEPLASIEIPGGPWSDEDEWRLFEDLACLEEWSGAALPMPTKVNAEEATRAAQAASWARNQRIRATLSGPLRFLVAEPVTEEPDEIRLSQEFSMELFGVELVLGTGSARVAIAEIEEPSQDDHGRWLTARPLTEEIVFWLTPPRSRRLPPLRTQPLEIHREPVPGRERFSDRARIASRARRSLSGVLAARREAEETAPISHGESLSTVLDDIRADRGP